MSFKAPESLSEQIAQHIGEQIITGKLKSKERIQELKVATDLEVSRGSVREALLILESRHLIDILPRRGAMVAELNQTNVKALYETYITLLVVLGTKVAEVWQPGQLDPLIEQLHKIRAIANSSDPEAPERVVAAGFDLMRMAYPLAENPYLESILEDLQPAIHRAYHMAITMDSNALGYSMTFFGQLLEGVVKRDLPKVKQSIQDYGDHLLSIMMDALEQ
ncbi:GntR family transcriptional regulator [Bermanella sp. R86510]|uniref:GntR family transcriptional regulator n=1 Tax=unclassified Bermanella TaxID=2627862 RepID=UPI0037C677AD